VREAVDDWLRDGLDGTSVEAPRQQHEQQERDRLMAGELWQEHGLVFASTVGTPLTANNVIRAFRIITKKAGLGDDWVPREMGHNFVSVLSASGVPVEGITLLAGHARTATTESVYRHGIRPALTQGARGNGQDLRLTVALSASQASWQRSYR